jgi:microcin C transport system permease protein
MVDYKSGMEKIWGIRITPLNARRIANFNANRRAFWSLWVFLVLFVVALPAEFIANDKPLLVRYDGAFYFPVVASYPETLFGGTFETEAKYDDPFVVDLIEAKGWLIMPPVPYSFDTHIANLPSPAPSPPTTDNWLGTDDQARDVVARLIYGFRISVLFGLILTFFSSVVGVAAGAVQGFFGGWLDLIFQRFLEIWSSLPSLYIIIIVSAVLVPSFWILLFIMLLFSWTTLVGLVRAEFLRARNFDYVRAANALGLSNGKVIFRHVLPNAMVATITFLPFITAGSLTVLTGLDLIGVGLPLGSPSLGEMLRQAKANMHAPWLMFTSFFAIAAILSLLIFIGEGIRDAFDPRKQVTGG